MKKNSILMAIFGFIFQIIFLFFITRRINFRGNIYPYYILVSALVLIYNLMIGPKNTIRKSSVIYFSSTIFAFIFAGLLANVGTDNFVRLVIYGVITGCAVATVFYHLARLFFDSASDKGFDYPVEIALTFFAASMYPVAAYIGLTIVEILVLFVILLTISFLLGYVMAIPLRRSNQLISETFSRGYSVAEFPQIEVSVLDRIWSEIKKFFSQLKKSFTEIGDIGNNIKTSSESLSSVSEEMNASLEEVSSTIQHIAKGAQDQSEAITTIARSIEELNNLTTSISSQVKMASVSSRRTTDSAKQGMEFSTRVAKILKEIFEQTKSIEEKMAELSNQASEIKKILDIIGGIAEQTDLLALNAAIEAARVGEQGKGFAVVADEIRNLATETQRSSSTVEDLISEINKSSQELNNLLNLEREKINDANDLASQTEEQFTGIAKAVDLVTDMVTRINEAAANQATNTKELVKQVEQVAQVAVDTAAASEEVSAAIEEQTASMQEFTSTAQILASTAAELDKLLTKSASEGSPVKK